MSQLNWIAERYEILEEIGRGGMGLVARAYDHRLETEVAIKVLLRDLAKDSGDKDSLIKEARVLARLTHPSIVRLFDLADTEIGLMLILEYVRGPNFAQVLEMRGRLTEIEFLSVARQVCAGLTAAHAEGVIHRDLKPPNLLVSPRVALSNSPEYLMNAAIKITDFGISKLLASRLAAAEGMPAASDGATKAAGTPIFMAPEQFAGRPCTPATDIYALGVITYMALSGRPPFYSDNVRDLARQHFQETADPIVDCSPQVNAVIQCALAKLPGERYQTAADFLHALEVACAPPPPPFAEPLYPQPPILEPDGLDRAAGWVGRHLRKFVVGAVATLGILITLAIWNGPLSQSVGTRGGSERPARPLLGKILDLPPDLDPVSTVKSLPAAMLGPPEPARPGPRKAPHALWTALVHADSAHTGPFVDGVSPDGIVLVRDEGAKSLWAIHETSFKWGFRAPFRERFRFVAHAAPWPDGSSADFRDSGRIWLASCSNPKIGCEGVVFNAKGEGGVYDQIPDSVRDRAAKAAVAVSSVFSKDDAQNGHWPNFEDPGLRYISRLGSVSLRGVDREWAIQLDGLPVSAVSARGHRLVATEQNTIYSINPEGRVLWKYSSPDRVNSMQVLPSPGAFEALVMAGKDHQVVRAIGAGVQRWEVNTRGWIRNAGAVDSTGAMYFVSLSNDEMELLGISPEGKRMWSMIWAIYPSWQESLRLDDSGRLYLTGWQLDVNGKTRRGVMCLVE
jgi:serine/threonine protein kinase